MIRVGIAGIGFMGMVHWLSYAQARGAKVTAICEQNKKRLEGDWRSIRGNFGPAGKKMNLGGVARYRRLDRLLADPEVDLVDVCLPPALHADVTLRALAADKHVFCEKPISLDVRDAKRMVAAAERAGKMLMVGHVLPLFPEYAYALKVVRSGRFGRLLGGNFKRVISNPKWLSGFFDPKKIGGPMLDLHVHDAHFIRLLFGMPRAVFSTGRMRGEVAEYFSTQFMWEDAALSVTAQCGVIEQQGRSFLHGFEIHLERATLVFEMAVLGDKPRTLMPLTVLGAGGKATCPKLAGGDPMIAFGQEVKAVARSVHSGTVSPILDARLARDALVLCEKQTRSLQTGKMVRV